MKRFYKAVVIPTLVHGVLIFSLFPSVIIAVKTVTDKSEKTATFTTVCFAIFIALSSLCFNWLRTLESEEDKAHAKIISDVAMDAIIAAICFALGSGVKFMSIQDTGKPSSIYSTLMDIGYFVFLTCSMVISATVIFRISKVYLKKRFDIEM